MERVGQARANHDYVLQKISSRFRVPLPRLAETGRSCSLTALLRPERLKYPTLRITPVGEPHSDLFLKISEFNCGS